MNYTSFFDILDKKILKLSIFPIYICKKQWELTKLYINPLFSIMINQHSALFCTNQINIIYMIFLEILDNMFTSIEMIYSVYRTCIVINNEYPILNIQSLVDDFINNPLNRTSQFIPSLNIFLGQILINNIVIDNIDNFCMLIYEEYVRRIIPKNITLVHFMEYIDNNILFNDNKLNNYLQVINTKKIIKYLSNFCRFYKLCNNIKIEYRDYNLLSIDEYNRINNFLLEIYNDNIQYDIEYTNKCVLLGIGHKNNKLRKNEINIDNYFNLKNISFLDLKNILLHQYNLDDKKNKTIKTIQYINKI
jgi:hypothetical protein